MLKKIGSIIWTCLTIIAWLVGLIGILWSFIGFVDEICYKTNRMHFPYRDGSSK